jgi:enamine deaminase RidA (YjgF/YER057c/UK114 family)
MSATVLERLERLPRRNLTVLALRGVSTLVPGGWQNQTSPEALISDVLGSDDLDLVQQVRARADELSRARHEGYRRALSLYDAVNRSQKAAGGLRVLANVAGALPLVKRLAVLTPASQTLQAVDLSLKVAAEMLAFTQVNGLPGDSFAAFGNTKTQTIAVMERIKAALKDRGYAMSDVVKLTVFLVGDPALGGFAHLQHRLQSLFADAAHFLDLHTIFIHRCDVSFCVTRNSVEIAKLTVRDANIGGVYISIDHPSYFAIRLLDFPQFISYIH